MRLLVANLFVTIVGMATTTVVAMLVGPPMIRRLMDLAIVPGTDSSHPYELAFRDATAFSVGIALAVSAIATLSLSWYFSRRVHRSATELSHAASAVPNGHYDIRVQAPRLRRELDNVAAAFNKMRSASGSWTTPDARCWLI
jgi:HAMP domain-containing protein